MAQTIGLLLLGAVAAGSGASYFLYQANLDREALIIQAETAKRQAAEAARSGKAVTDEANRKLEQASQEVTKAQTRVRELEEERAWFAKARILTPSRTTTYWKEWLNYSHGFTIRLPLNVTNVKNDANGMDAEWIVIKPYTNESIATETAYVVGDRLLVGSINDTSWMFRVQSSAVISHIVSIYPNTRLSEKTILDALSTLTFRDE